MARRVTSPNPCSPGQRRVLAKCLVQNTIAVASSRPAPVSPADHRGPALPRARRRTPPWPRFEVNRLQNVIVGTDAAPTYDACRWRVRYSSGVLRTTSGTFAPSRCACFSLGRAPRTAQMAVSRKGQGWVAPDTAVEDSPSCTARRLTGGVHAMAVEIFYDPASGRPYRVNPATGQSEWVDGAPAQPFRQTSQPQPMLQQPAQGTYSTHDESRAARKQGVPRWLWGVGGLVIGLVLGAGLARLSRFLDRWCCLLVDGGFGVGPVYDLSSWCPAVQVEDLGELVLGRAGFGEHAAVLGRPPVEG